MIAYCLVSEVSLALLPPYTITCSRSWQGGLLLKFFQAAYRELSPDQDLAHLAQTVTLFYQPDRSPVWFLTHASETVGCLWCGPGVDQTNGARTAYIFLVYIHPDHRRLGLATYLLHTAFRWAKAQGLTEIQLQVLIESEIAQVLYRNLGFKTRAYVLSRSLGSDGS